MDFDNNSVLLADTFEIIHTFPDNYFDVVITDPPYDFEIGDIDWIHRQFLRVSKNLIIVFSPPENPWVLPADQYLFWIKPISTKNTSKSYSRFVEQIFVYGRNEWNINRHWSQYTNVFKDLVEERNHPYRKPYSLMERLILNHTKIGDFVLDPFCGSGTTLLACKNNEVNYLGIEKNLGYYELALERLK